MAEIIKEDGTGHRTHVRSPLMRESLVSKDLAKGMVGRKVVQIIPDCHFVSVGGHSIFDRGREALMPLIDSVVAARKNHRFVVAVGGGARMRHTVDICLDLGIPTGGIASVTGAVDEQNQRMLWSLLAKHNGISMNKANFLDLPLWLQQGMIPIVSSMPPYHFWEQPNGRQRIPLNGHDVGVVLFGEVLGAKSVILVKDEDGLYTNDPKVDPKAEFIPKIGVRELLERKLQDLIIERVALEVMLGNRNVRRIQIINGLKPELLELALQGKHVGTIIDADL